MQTTSIKSLPVTDLNLAAICVVLGFNPDIGENGMVEAEMEVIDEALWESFRATNQPNRCACCGHRLVHACAVVHKPTGDGFWIGRQCANRIEALRRFDASIKSHTMALALRLACDKREADFLAEHPDAMSVIAWTRKPHAPRIAKDMLEKLRRFGGLSEKQVAVLEKIKNDDEARRASATGTAPTGRQKVKGTVVSTKEIGNKFVRGKWDVQTIRKLVVDLGNGVRVFGSAPESAAAVAKGDTISFTATFEPSKNDPLFGFWKRPTKMAVVVKAEPAPAEISGASDARGCDPHAVQNGPV